jgi:hypothetical protein
MARFAQDSLNGLTAALRTLHFHRLVRLHNNLLKEIAALKASKLKDGHRRNSQNTRFHDNDVKL